MSVVNILPKECWETACKLEDLIPESGICVLIQRQQIAIYYLPSETPAVYALSNWDPIGGASVMSRGITGSVGGELVIASPLYKQHFGLTTGLCLEQPEYSLKTFAVRLIEDNVQLQMMD